jgi:hypothetical protein
MQNSSLVSRGLANDAQGILAAVEGMAFMKLESAGNLGFACGSDADLRFKLGTTPLADRERRWLESNVPEPALQHVSSLPPALTPVDFKRHHYRLKE